MNEKLIGIIWYGTCLAIVFGVAIGLFLDLFLDVF